MATEIGGRDGEEDMAEEKDQRADQEGEELLDGR